MLLDNPLSPDPRVQKEAKTLAEAGYDVTVYCQQKEGLPAIEVQDDYTIRRTFKYKLGTTVKIKKYLQAQQELWSSITEKYDIYHCHDVETWPIGYYLAKRDRALLIYDSHEYFPDMIVKGNYQSKFKYYASKVLFYWRGALFIGKADRIITVSNIIAQQLKEQFHLIRTPLVLFNTHFRKDFPQGNLQCLREKFNIDEQETILYYHGNIDPSRGIEHLLEIVAKLDHCKLVIAGKGAEHYLVKLSSLVNQNKLKEKVIFAGFIQPGDLLSVASSADLLLYFPVEVVKNVTFSMPNKFFDFLFAGKPMVVTGLPEIKSFMEKENLGIIIPKDRFQTDYIVAQINELIKDKDKYHELVSKYKSAREIHCWEAEASKLIKFYQELLSS